MREPFKTLVGFLYTIRMMRCPLVLKKATTTSISFCLKNIKRVGIITALLIGLSVLLMSINHQPKPKPSLKIITHTNSAYSTTQHHNPKESRTTKHPSDNLERVTLDDSQKEPTLTHLLNSTKHLIETNPEFSVIFFIIVGILWVGLRKMRKKRRALIDYVKQSLPLKLLYLPTSSRFAKARRELKSNFSPLGHKGDYLLGLFGVARNEPLHLLGHKTDKHLLTIAPTRTGKGRGLILPNLLNLPNHSVFVIDPKGENALVSAKYRQSQGHEIVIFNPYEIYADVFAERGFTQFQTFNPLKSLDANSPNFADDVAAIAEALIYDSGGDSHWTEAARGLIEFLIMYLITESTEEPSFQRLRSLITKEYEGIEEILERCALSDFHQIRDGIERYAKKTGELSSIFSTAETQTKIFKSETICAALNGEGYDFGRMKTAKVSVYLILPSERLITQARYLRLILLVAMSQFLRSEKGAHQVLMILDEFANIGTLKVIENGYGLIAGHGVTLWSFVQNLTQLQKLYPNNWEVFIANSAVVTVANVNDVATAEYFNKRAGKKLIERISHSQGGSLASTNAGTNTSQLWEDALPVCELYQAPADSIFLVIEGKTEPVRANKIFYDLHEPFCSLADSNPMLTVNGSDAQQKAARNNAIRDKEQNAIFAEDFYCMSFGDQRGKKSGALARGLHFFRPFFWTIELGKFCGSLVAIMISVTGVLYFGAVSIDNFINRNSESNVVKALNLNEIAGQEKLRDWVDSNIAAPLGVYEERLKQGLANGEVEERWRLVAKGAMSDLKESETAEKAKKDKEKIKIEKMRKLCASGKKMGVEDFTSLTNCYDISRDGIEVSNHNCYEKRISGSSWVVEGLPSTQQTPENSCHVRYTDTEKSSYSDTDTVLIGEGDITLLNLVPLNVDETGASKKIILNDMIALTQKSISECKSDLACSSSPNFNDFIQKRENTLSELQENLKQIEKEALKQQKATPPPANDSPSKPLIKSATDTSESVWVSMRNYFHNLWGTANKELIKPDQQETTNKPHLESLPRVKKLSQITHNRQNQEILTPPEPSAYQKPQQGRATQ